MHSNFRKFDKFAFRGYDDVYMTNFRNNPHFAGFHAVNVLNTEKYNKSLFTLT